MPLPADGPALLKSIRTLVVKSGNRSPRKLKKWVSGRSCDVGTHILLLVISAAAAACFCFLSAASASPGRASIPPIEGVVVDAPVATGGATPHRLRLRSAAVAAELAATVGRELFVSEPAGPATPLNTVEDCDDDIAGVKEATAAAETMVGYPALLTEAEDP